MKKFMIEDNDKGLTLLEMIISVAILSIVLVTVTSFMVTGMKMFRSSNDEIGLQQDVQLALNNVENRIIDAKMGIRCDDDGTQMILTVYNDKAGTEAKEYIVWNRNDKKIYYDTSAANVTLTTFSTNEVLASNVTNFQIVMKDGNIAATATPNPSVTAALTPSVTAQPTKNASPKNPKVEIAIEVEEDGRKHVSQKVVTFRNNIAMGASDTIYTGSGNGLDSKAEGVKITPQDVYLVPGESYQFHARVTGTGHPSQVVTWSVNSTGVSVDSTGLVKVDATTAAGGTVQVIATAPENSDGVVPAGSANIHISKIDGISVTTDAEKVYAGSMLKVNATVSGAELNDDMSKVTFSVKENPSWVHLYSNSGVFGLDKEARGKTFTIVATSVHDPTITGELVVKVQDTALSDLGSGVVTANRNSSTELLTNVVGQNLASTELQIQWEIADYGGLSSDKVSVGKYSGMLNVAKDINYENEYHLQVAAKITADRLSEPVTTYVSVTIPKVSIKFINGDGGAEIQKNSTVILPYEVIGLDGAMTEIMATTNPSVRNSLIFVTEGGVSLSIGNDVKTNKISVIATFKDTNMSDTIDVTVK